MTTLTLDPVDLVTLLDYLRTDFTTSDMQQRMKRLRFAVEHSADATDTANVAPFVTPEVTACPVCGCVPGTLVDDVDVDDQETDPVPMLEQQKPQELKAVRCNTFEEVQAVFGVPPRVCTDCGIELSPRAKKDLCPKCGKKRYMHEFWKTHPDTRDRKEAQPEKKAKKPTKKKDIVTPVIPPPTTTSAHTETSSSSMDEPPACLTKDQVMKRLKCTEPQFLHFKKYRLEAMPGIPTLFTAASVEAVARDYNTKGGKAVGV